MCGHAPVRHLLVALAAALLSVAAAMRPVEPRASAEAFASLGGCVALTAGDVRRLDEGRVVTHVLRGGDREVSVFAARRLSVDGDRLLAWVEAIEELKRSPAVHAIARLSDPPRAEDLAGLTLNEADLEALARCRPGDCAFKLTGDEQQRIRPAGHSGMPAAFRGVLLDRVDAYRRGGLAALGRYDDGRTPRSIDETSRALVTRLPCLERHLPDLARLLDRYPATSVTPLLSFFYWSMEEFRGRPVVLATHVVAMRQRVAGRTETVVAGRQLYAAHYMNAGLNLTGVIDMPDGRHFLFVLNRTSVDVVSGILGGVVRSMVERRLRADVSTIVDQVGRRLESGEPGR